ncbi:glycosyltransferase family 4 protein [Chitinispirillales bacterium ANBcel5]|uniref:glycosyltransferase family 4 protein n=1 Tax=Cellulosispirillum alkaliphilum TaxID=3039283 RepID=UPI002A4E40C6|nr:glycosyltransferase family 4 protein [Chitinispirillales bacterium ANBcel5]
MNGKPCSTHLTYKKFWQRYLEVFNNVIVIGRLFNETGCTRMLNPVEGKGVTFLPVSPYTGPKEFLKNYTKIIRTIENSYIGNAVYILRVPGVLGYVAYNVLKKHRHPYAVEVVGDPYDVFAPGVINHPVRPIIRYWTRHNLRKLCRNAIAASYVTKSTLQKRYPHNEKAYSTHYSSISLPEYSILKKPKKFNSNVKTLITIGSMSQMHKGHNILLDSLVICQEKGCDLELIIVGDGKYKSQLEQYIQKVGLSGKVRLTGQLRSGKDIYDALDSADLFVLPSFTEGLPRVLIEAMARGLPCIGTDVGGVPELLNKEELVQPGNAAKLADKIIEVINDRERLNVISRENLTKACEYSTAQLSLRRVKFYKKVKELTEIATNK